MGPAWLSAPGLATRAAHSSAAHSHVTQNAVSANLPQGHMTPHCAAAQPGSETELVVPYELKREEVHLLQEALGRSGRRSQRSLQQHPTSLQDNLFLSLPAFGKELYLQLRRDDSFISDGFVVEEQAEDGTVRQTRVLDASRACFYTGAVLNHTDSFASLSTCGGLTGVAAEVTELDVLPLLP
ncbi:hypothetical protein ACEWY4_015896 [Coilia grayii]|uniref:Peptidase M12B propeptide domain-containing protein n=1 Tax=Coilia grayii TaxID=363190 RepID=A0ABD1JQ82_9TELE